jgi:DNA-binding PadR family transcriptional regulator
MLARESFSGYDLTTHFDRSVGILWHATHPQIYRELDRLRRERLVSDQLVVQTGRPNKRVYSITPKGQRELLAWVASPAPVEMAMKAPMLLRAYSYGRIDPEVAAARLAEYRELWAERLAHMREREKGAAALRDDVARTGALLTLKAGILHAEAYVRWCDWALDVVRRPVRRRPRRGKSTGAAR